MYLLLQWHRAPNWMRYKHHCILSPKHPHCWYNRNPHWNTFFSGPGYFSNISTSFCFHFKPLHFIHQGSYALIPKTIRPLALTRGLTFHISVRLGVVVPPPLPVGCDPSPASAPAQQHGSLSKRGVAQKKGLGQREGLLSCDAVIPESQGEPSLWMDGAMFCPGWGSPD